MHFRPEKVTANHAASKRQTMDCSVRRLLNLLVYLAGCRVFTYHEVGNTVPCVTYISKLVTRNNRANVRITLQWQAKPLLWKSNVILSKCVCRLSYLPFQAHAPFYTVTCGLSGWTIFFPHYLINGTIFGNTLLYIKCVFLFSLQLLSEIFLILRIIQRDILIDAHTKVQVTLFIFNCNFNFLDRFSKILKYQVSRRSVQWEPSCYMQTDGRTWK
jgi:hypothetical protein